ncbi:uncharacterized protein STEHIDRAFT_159696 [Stereum hirsutum FP-91666 SS1]|uniref:uncharacterized protein n=1 Tax=Stereum hirsutum (strain FP-91666) TaxID=721885 RepID=UPI000444A48A|nr:uncharacterized protein STEHIDRAFT_159696 [Stereum hirsutum FP-91666 SS1]EIM84099.1 hypothetical protein STEHIDRAFT_159696 [Stereum hirsutum FP-91666 SS1]
MPLYRLDGGGFCLLQSMYPVESVHYRYLEGGREELTASDDRHLIEWIGLLAKYLPEKYLKGLAPLSDLRRQGDDNADETSEDGEDDDDGTIQGNEQKNAFNLDAVVGPPPGRESTAHKKSRHVSGPAHGNSDPLGEYDVQPAHGRSFSVEGESKVYHDIGVDEKLHGEYDGNAILEPNGDDEQEAVAQLTGEGVNSSTSSASRIAQAYQDER